MKKYASFFLTLIALALLTSCDDNDIEKRQVAFTATMPSDDLSFLRPGSIINGVPDGTGLSAHWKEGDKIQLFVRQDGKVYQVESPATVYDISSDGKNCSFQVTLPKSVNRDKDYDIIGVTGVEAYIDGNDVIASCNLTRVGIDGNGELSFPMWFTAKKGSNQAKFRHLCAYEVLSVNNNSDSSIRLRHGGFEVMTPWYRYNDKVALTDNAFSGYEAGQNDVQSNEITIDAWETGTIVSWYIPRFDVTDDTPGATINNAKLKAVVNGSTVTTIDALKAYKNFARGYAYYMQVIWDGSSLCFSNDFCPDGNHPHMIDLGLPSGTKWTCCNVGANTPIEFGGYFSWGEVIPKSSFGLNNYKWYANGNDHNISKYCCNSDYGTVDNRIELEPVDDAAYVNWGPEWRMPSIAQIRELLNNCTGEWTIVNGIGGYLFNSCSNDSAIFFPLAGWNPKGMGIDAIGNYWSRGYDYDIFPNWACVLCIKHSNTGAYAAYYARHWGANVRAVYVAQG
ncbi:MAG: hypothetical protein VZR53_05295 [Prevotella sp.]|nr:hypothetical protein [Prevotella sp.]